MQTLSHYSEASSGQRRESAQLCLSLPHRPRDPAAAFLLTGLDVVTVGRGDQRGFSRSGRTLAIALADPWMSGSHARLAFALGRWTVEDAGSKNGTRVNGVRIDRQVLVDRDVLEIGHSYFVFRAAVTTAIEQPDDVDLAHERPPARGLATLVPALAQTFAGVARIAPSEVSVMIGGPSGSGKEVVARAVHQLSGRRGAFVAVNCGALPEALAASALFGHKKGAFSGAIDDSVGFVRSADGGTLFLDEIGDLPLPTQAMLLRVLQEGEVTPLGTTKPIRVDVRVVSATHRDLPARVAAGEFRQDLLMRLGGYAVALPALHQRSEDLGLIIAALLEKLAPGRDAVIEPQAVRCLYRHAWPGNVRELERCLGAALVLAGAGAITAAHLPAELSGEGDADEPGDGGAQRDALIALLREHRGNVTAVGRALGKAPVQIRRWMKRWSLDPDSFRAG